LLRCLHSIAARTAIAAIGGGVGSKLAGGSFADGAYSAAFFHLFNQESRRNWKRPHGNTGSVHDSLQFFGLIPVVGEFFDAIDGFIYLAEGERGMAVLSFSSMVPFAGNAVGVGRIVGKMPIWTSTKAKSGLENAYGHWKKHGNEFPEFQNAKQYVDGTRDFLNSPPPGTLVKTRPNGDKVFYNPVSNTFGIQSAGGAPRTMFKPDPAKHGYSSNLDYFNAQ
jgi:hypothetical protein